MVLTACELALVLAHAGLSIASNRHIACHGERTRVEASLGTSTRDLNDDAALTLPRGKFGRATPESSRALLAGLRSARHRNIENCAPEIQHACHDSQHQGGS